MPPTLPDKLFYKIGEVAQAAGVRTSVLRFWESEFSFLSPVKSSSGQRLYSRNEVDIVFQVKKMLYDEKFTIEGVKKRISAHGKRINSDELSRAASPPGTCSEVLNAVRTDLKALRDSL